ncbi:enoyl-ACP reductase II [Caldalkalibacillus thermarum]|uniref:NAD(P)H-dependent flavin oxidoreductase n=1 Tax=Caldalkalibacillus thermarum TaxID=296745 RepID=UPI0016645835|nr:nitronate monooxygenase [Caldalkalibacillus thermarum]GGK31381.1 enoyl-ACP reductase II [Caldalkalibacillus thermarum]
MISKDTWCSNLASHLSPLKLHYPFIQGGMGNISPPELCAAVSRAGGLGQIGAGSLPVGEVEAKVKKVLDLLGDRYEYGLNVPLSVHPNIQGVMDLILTYKIPVVSLSAGNPQPWAERLKAEGIKVMVVVSTVRQAKKAEEAGADVIVAEGFEAAGKNSPKELTTMTLIPQVARAVSCPVVAAGGIGDGRGFLAALALGARGVQMGTRLIATMEAHVHEHYQQALLESGDEDTLVVGRRYGRVTRLLKTPYAERIAQAERDGMEEHEFLRKLDEESHYRGAILGQLDQGHVNAGQISGAIDRIVTVQELFESMVDEAYQALGALSLGEFSGEERR